MSYHSDDGDRIGFLQMSDSSYSRLWVIPEQPLAFATNNLERMRIDGSGNVGIGTSSPSYPLHVAAGSSYAYFSSNAVSAIKSVRGSSQNAGIDIGNTVGTWTIGKATDGFFGFSHNNQNINGSALFAITTAGNVGIGDTTPSYKLDVNGTAGFSSTINAPNIGAGEDDSVVILDSDGKLRTDEIDSRVWGSTLVDGAGSASGVAVWSDSNTLTYDTNLIWDSTNDRLGIRKSNPEYDIDIYKGGLGANANLRLSDSTSNSIALQTNSTGGTTNSALQFGTTSDNDSRLEFGYRSLAGSASSDLDLQYNYINTKTFDFTFLSASGTVFTYDLDNDHFGFFTDDMDYAFDVNATGNFRGDVYTSGNVGIGTASPTNKLEVAGGNVLLFPSDNTRQLSLYSSSYGLKASAGLEIFTGDTIRFRKGGTEYVRIDTSGNLGIGTTSPLYTLDVAGTGNFSGDVSIDGHLSASTKSFLINHPTRPGHKLQYGSLESPYHGIRLTGRGTIQSGWCVIKLPEYICNLVRDDESVNVQITNYKHSKLLYVSDIDIANNEFTIKTDSWFTRNNLEFFWTFTAVRKDVDPLKVEF
jgi:hypothetical protein